MQFFPSSGCVDIAIIKRRYTPRSINNLELKWTLTKRMEKKFHGNS